MIPGAGVLQSIDSSGAGSSSSHKDGQRNSRIAGLEEKPEPLTREMDVMAMLKLMREEQKKNADETKDAIEDFKLNIKTTVQETVQEEMNSKVVPQIQRAMDEAQAARREVADLRTLVDSDKASSANGSVSNSVDGGKPNLGPIGMRRKMCVGGFEENTERDLVLEELRKWMQDENKTDKYESMYAFTAIEIGYTTWRNPNDMHNFIEEYKRRPEENKRVFEGRTLWCNGVMCTRRRRKETTEHP